MTAIIVQMILDTVLFNMRLSDNIENGIPLGEVEGAGVAFAQQYLKDSVFEAGLKAHECNTSNSSTIFMSLDKRIMIQCVEC